MEKHCRNCNISFEESLSSCPECGSQLSPLSEDIQPDIAEPENPEIKEKASPQTKRRPREYGEAETMISSLYDTGEKSEVTPKRQTQIRECGSDTKKERDDGQTPPNETTGIITAAIEAQAVTEEIDLEEKESEAETSNDSSSVVETQVVTETIDIEPEQDEANAETIALPIDSKTVNSATSQTEDVCDQETMVDLQQQPDTCCRDTLVDPFAESVERVTSLISEDSTDLSEQEKDISIENVQDQNTLVDPFAESVERVTSLVSEDSPATSEGREEKVATGAEGQDLGSLATQEIPQSIADTGARTAKECDEQPSGSTSQNQAFHPTRLEGDIFDMGEILQRKYKIIEFLGQGGMGAVYKVEHLLLPNKKFFALKILHPHLSQNTTFRKRFIREVEMAMEFAHPHVVQIRDFGETDNGAQFFTMDFSDGDSLRSILKKDSIIPEARAFKIIKQALAALSCGHEKGIVHRDLKPENILIEKRHGKDHAMVLDFGIAKLLTGSSDEKITQHQVIGTPIYMSPEQASGENLDMRTDLYSMGVILYEMATGQVPYQGNSREILLGHMVRPLPSPREIRPSISPTMENIISKAMEKERNDRYRNAEAFIADIDRALGLGQSISVTQERPMPVAKKPSKASWAIAAILLLALVGAAGTISYMQVATQSLEKKFKGALDSRNYDKAKEIIDKMRLSWFTRGNTSELQKRLDEKRKSLIAEGISALQQKNFDDARAKLEQAQKIEKRVAETTVLGSISRIFKGNEFIETGNWNEALLSFQDAQKMAGLVEIPYLTKAIEHCRDKIAESGIAALKRGDLQKSLQIFQQSPLQSIEFKTLISNVQKIRRGLEAKEARDWENAYTLLREAQSTLEASDITVDGLKQSIVDCEKHVSERLVERALQLLGQGQFQSSLEILQRSPRKDKRVKEMLAVVERIRSGMNASKNKEWDKAVEILDISQVEIKALLPDKDIPMIRETISYCKTRMTKENLTKGLQLLREGKFDDTRKFFEERLKITQDSRTKKAVAAVKGIGQGIKSMKRKKYETALKKLKDSRKLLQQVSPGIEVPSLNTAIAKCEARVKTTLAEKTKKNKKNLAKMLKKAKKEYESKNNKKTQRLLEQFFDKGGAKLGAKSEQKASRLLALVYCRQGKWEKSLKWFKRTKLNSQAIAYYGLACYHCGRDDEKALKLIEKALERKPSLELTRELCRAQVDILVRSFPEQEHRLLRDFKKYEKLASSEADLLPYWKKLGYLAKKCGNDRDALLYLQHYLQATGKKDEDVINELIGLQNFYPLGKGYHWRYKLLLLGGKKMDRIINVKIVDKKGSGYSVDAAGALENWYLEGGYLYKRNQKIIPQSLRLGKEWKRETKNRIFYARVTDANLVVSTRAGKFSCVEITLTSQINPDYKRKEYYAPGIGEVRVVEYDGKNKNYETTLVKYNVN